MVAAAATPSSLFPNPLQARFPALPLRGVFVIHLSYRQGGEGTGGQGGRGGGASKGAGRGSTGQELAWGNGGQRQLHEQTQWWLL